MGIALQILSGETEELLRQYGFHWRQDFHVFGTAEVWVSPKLKKVVFAHRVALDEFHCAVVMSTPSMMLRYLKENWWPAGRFENDWQATQMRAYFESWEKLPFSL